MQNQAFSVSSRTSALRVLFSLYITGRIADTLWRQLMSVFDTYSGKPEEREALALYVMDSFRESGPESIEIPKIEEVQELMTMMHSAGPDSSRVSPVEEKAPDCIL